MFCGNCGSKLNDGASFCANCGAQVNNVSVQQNKPTKKSINPIIYILPIAIVIIIVAVLFIFGSKLNDNNAIYGEWKCNDHMIFKFNSNKTFEIYEMDDKSELYVKGKYKIDSESKAYNVIKYSLTLTSNYRVVDGETYDNNNSYTMLNMYEIALYTDKLDEMVMINGKTYNTYYCEKNEP